MVAFDLGGSVSLTTIPVLDVIGPKNLTPRIGKSGRPMQVVAVASIAATESAIYVLHSPTGSIDGRKATALDLITAAGDRTRLYISAPEKLSAGIVAALPNGDLLVLDHRNEQFLLIGSEQLPSASLGERGSG